MSHLRFGSAVTAAVLLAVSFANVVWCIRFGKLYYPLPVQNFVSLSGVALGLYSEGHRRLDRTDRRLQAVEDRFAREDREMDTDLAELAKARALRSVGR
jgi:hypothetical protein